MCFGADLHCKAINQLDCLAKKKQLGGQEVAQLKQVLKPQGHPFIFLARRSGS